MHLNKHSRKTVAKLYKELVLLFSFFMQSCLYSHSSKDEAFYFPAQWEEQESVWLGWAHDTGIQRLHLDMARAIHPHVGITVLARSDGLLKVAFQQLLSAGVDMAVLQSLFPDRKIVQLNPMALNRWGGGMNCATQQQPKR